MGNFDNVLKVFHINKYLNGNYFIDMGIFQQIFLTFKKKVVNIFIQKIINSGWVWIWKWKLCGRTLKSYQVRDKPNLDNIFKSYSSYYDLEDLHNSPNHFERLRICFLQWFNNLVLHHYLSLLHLLKDYGILSLKLYTHYMLQN